MYSFVETGNIWTYQTEQTNSCTIATTKFYHEEMPLYVDSKQAKKKKSWLDLIPIERDDGHSCSGDNKNEEECLQEREAAA